MALHILYDHGLDKVVFAPPAKIVTPPLSHAPVDTKSVIDIAFGYRSAGRRVRSPNSIAEPSHVVPVLLD